MTVERYRPRTPSTGAAPPSWACGGGGRHCSPSNWTRNGAPTRAASESLFRRVAAPAGQRQDRAYRRAFAELSAAPLFTSEVEPDAVRLVQSETVNSLQTVDGSWTRPAPRRRSAWSKARPNWRAASTASSRTRSSPTPRRKPTAGTSPAWGTARTRAVSRHATPRSSRLASMASGFSRVRGAARFVHRSRVARPVRGLRRGTRHHTAVDPHNGFQPDMPAQTPAAGPDAAAGRGSS